MTGPPVRAAADPPSESDPDGCAAQVGMMEALDLIGRAGILLDGNADVLRRNAAAAKLEGDGFVVAGRRLRATERRCDSALQALLGAGTSAPTDPPWRERFVALHRRAGRPLIARIGQVQGCGFGEARSLLTLSRLEIASDPPAPMLAEAFSLTAAERALAGRLASGAGLVLAASALGVSLSTARTHLKAIFAKTETHSQSQLAALLSCAACRFESGAAAEGSV